MTVCADKKSQIEVKDNDFVNILVSLWKVISQEEYYVLCLGALVKANLIFVTTQCSHKLDPLSEVGVLTGMNNITDYPEKILSSEQPFRDKSKFSILVVSIPT